MAKKSKDDALQQTVSRTGTTEPIALMSTYPKRYEILLELDLETNRIKWTRKAENLSSWELYGLLKILALEVERQILIKPDTPAEPEPANNGKQSR